MDIFHAIILGAIEGLTEFLPVSSTGHLIVASEWMGLDQSKENAAFEVIIQLAAILAVVANYSEKFTLRYFDLWLKIAIAFIPIGAIGFLFSDQIKALFDVKIVAIMFIIGGIIFLIVEHYQKDRVAEIQYVEDVSFKQAGLIGLAQVFALVPGTSRAGSTIIGAMLVGLSRKASAEFSFLLAMPVMVAASGYDFLKNYKEFTDANLIALGVGFLTAFIVAYLAMKLFIRFLEHFTFVSFGIYRILFGVLLLALIYNGTLGAH